MPFAVEISGLLGALTLLIGVWGVLAPGRIKAFVAGFSSAGGLWSAVAIRIVLGFALWFAAPASRAPLLLQIIGALALIAAVVLPFIGVERFKALIDWWTKLSPTAVRFNCLFAVAFGAAILWALLPSAT
jgi:hypothetical protein